MIHDFADWLSPMLVKELRQGIRSRVLISSLFILQGLLIFNVVIAFTVADMGADSQGTTAFFWSILSLPLLLILPLSALGSVGGEIKNNTLELIFLTRLNAWRIVLGKWIAIVVQALLLTLTVLPYIALRYYLGGVNMLQDLRTVGGILLGSAVFTAVVISVSPFQSKLLRILLFIAIFLFLQIGGVMAASLLFDGGGRVLRGGGLPDWTLYAGIGLFLPIFVLLMLGVAVSRIAPLAENHAGPRRLLGLLMLMVCGVTSQLARDAEVLLIVGQIIITPICLGALCENVPVLSSLYRPFVRRGWWGRLAARMFTPGWNTGFIYTWLVLAMLAVFWWRKFTFDFDAAGRDKFLAISFLAFATTLWLPAAVVSSSVKKRFISYLVLVTVSGLFLFVTSIIGGITHSQIQDTAVIFPPVSIFAGAFSNIGENSRLLAGWLLLLMGLSFFVMLFRIRQPGHPMKKLFDEATLPLPNHDA